MFQFFKEKNIEDQTVESLYKAFLVDSCVDPAGYTIAQAPSFFSKNFKSVFK